MTGAFARAPQVRAPKSWPPRPATSNHPSACRSCSSPTIDPPESMPVHLRPTSPSDTPTPTTPRLRHVHLYAKHRCDTHQKQYLGSPNKRLQRLQSAQGATNFVRETSTPWPRYRRPTRPASRPSSHAADLATAVHNDQPKAPIKTLTCTPYPLALRNQFVATRLVQRLPRPARCPR